MLPRRRTARLAPALLVAMAALPAAVHGGAAHSRFGVSTLGSTRRPTRVAPQLVEVRHRLHQNPELSNREAQTAELVAAHLRALGLEPRTGIGKTASSPSSRGASRARSSPSARTWTPCRSSSRPTSRSASTKKDTFLGQEVGVAHACGHDVHTSVLLGVGLRPDGDEEGPRRKRPLHLPARRGGAAGRRARRAPT